MVADFLHFLFTRFLFPSPWYLILPMMPLALLLVWLLLMSLNMWLCCFYRMWLHMLSSYVTPNTIFSHLWKKKNIPHYRAPQTAACPPVLFLCILNMQFFFQPLLKKLDPDNTVMANFRPIPKLTLVSKISREVVHAQLKTHREEHNILKIFQSGLCLLHSTVSIGYGF